MSKMFEEFKDCLTERQWKGYQFEMQVQDMLSLLKVDYEGNPRNPLEWLMNDAMKTKDERRVDVTAFYQENSYCIEMKFNNYVIYPCHFKNDILPRFLKTDKEHKNIWVLCVWDKSRISSQVLSLCEEYNIKICELLELPYVFGIEIPVLALSNVNINNKVCRLGEYHLSDYGKSMVLESVSISRPSRVRLRFKVLMLRLLSFLSGHARRILSHISSNIPHSYLASQKTLPFPIFQYMDRSHPSNFFVFIRK